MGDESYYTYRARVRRVIDGDTFELFIDQGFHDYTVQTVRLKDVDTAEIYGTAHDSEEYAQGIAQKRFVEQFLGGDDVTENEFPLTLKTYGKGKYGRWLGNVWRDDDGLSEALLEEWPESTY